MKCIEMQQPSRTNDNAERKKKSERGLGAQTKFMYYEPSNTKESRTSHCKGLEFTTQHH